jgi:hypothetical protein
MWSTATLKLTDKDHFQVILPGGVFLAHKMLSILGKEMEFEQTMYRNR